MGKAITVNLGPNQSIRRRSGSIDSQSSERKRPHKDADPETTSSAKPAAGSEQTAQTNDTKDTQTDQPAGPQRAEGIITEKGDRKSLSEEQEERGRPKNRGSTEETPPEQDYDDSMISLMGFAGFKSTKGKHVEATKSGGAQKIAKSEYRQYINRSKGFNRSLSPSRK